MLIALTREVPSSINACELTHVARTPIDVAAARAQHAAYEAALQAAGCTLRRLPAADDLPDSVFVEDAAVVVDELAVVTRPGAASRRAETSSVAEALRAHRDVVAIEEPGTLDGGDVLQVGRTVYVGRGGRTNAEGIRQLRRHAATRGRTVVPVRLHGVLHLKSAVTALPDGTCLAHDVSLFDASPFPAIRRVPEEAGSHVILLGGGTLVMAASAPRSAELFDDMGFDVVTVDIAEFEKREGCVTCLSVLVAGADA